jgi:hypothetical protein
MAAIEDRDPEFEVNLLTATVNVKDLPCDDKVAEGFRSQVTLNDRPQG